MKCKNCGAPVASKLPACKYCGTENGIYIKRKQEMEFLFNIFNSEKRKALLEAAPDIIVRVLNRFVLISIVMLIAVTAISIGISIITYESYSTIDGVEEKHVLALEEMHKENRLDEIFTYMYENHLSHSDYPIYFQIRELYDSMKYFLMYSRFFEDSQKKLADGEDVSYYEERSRYHYYNLLSCAHSVYNYLEQSFSDEKEIFPENNDYYQEYITEVTAYLKYKYGLSDEEIKELCTLKDTYGDEFETYAGELYGRYSLQRKAD